MRIFFLGSRRDVEWAVGLGCAAIPRRANRRDCDQLQQHSNRSAGLTGGRGPYWLLLWVIGPPLYHHPLSLSPHPLCLLVMESSSHTKHGVWSWAGRVTGTVTNSSGWATGYGFIHGVQTHHGRSTFRHGCWHNRFYGMQQTMEFSLRKNFLVFEKQFWDSMRSSLVNIPS